MAEIELGKAPPSATELEEAVIGACLLDQSGMADVADFLRPEAFYLEANAVIWRVMLSLYERRDPVDILTVTQRIQKLERLEQVGGAFRIAELARTMASTANVQYHARIIQQAHIGRQVIDIGHRMVMRGYEPTADVFDTLSEAHSEIRILNEHAGGEERNMAEVMGDLVDNPQKDRGVRFGFDALDDMLRAEPGTVTIIGARPAMGKTAFMLSSAWRQAKAGRKPYVLEMEMKDRNLANRLACGECSIPVWKAKRGLLDQQDVDKRAAWYIHNGDALKRMTVNESSSLKVSSLAARLDRAKRRNGIDVVWVDYIGLLQPSTKQRPGYDRMTAISNELRVIAKDLDLPIICLAQLNRPMKGASVKPPVLTDLRDSGEIEQDAEAVCFLHRPKYYDKDADDGVDFIVAKNRDGEDGVARLMFDGPGVRMVDVQQDTTWNPSKLTGIVPHPDNRIDDEPPPF